ncbi:MAG TPA: hypothetical protein VLC09_05125, partial [Polyangiaceae bacterium]|nr:hypothetical protein [Polyangiaceae bacterium]
FGEFASLPSGSLSAGGTASDRAGHSAAAARGALARTNPATRARLTSGGVHVCQDVLGLQHFRGEPSALVKVAIDREGDVRFAGLAAPHPGGAALERATAACVSRFRFAPARDEQGRATASSAVLKLTAAR